MLGEDVLLKATNSQNLAFYINEDDTNPVIEASEVTIQSVTSDTTVFVTNLENGFESRKKPVHIQIQAIKADFFIEPDTASETTAARLISTSEVADSLRWLVDGVYIGSGVHEVVEITKTDYSISLIAFSSLGCVDSLSRDLTFQQSALPEVNLAPVCVGDMLNIHPENGNIFGFYRDEALEQLIKKGQSLTIDSVLQDTSIFVVGLDSLLPSEPKKVDISPIRFEFEIITAVDTLYLSESLTASFSIDTNDITQSAWYINGQFVEAGQNPTLLFDSAGLYHIECIALNTKGCSGQDHFSLTVLDKRPEAPLSSPYLKETSIYPNPNHGNFSVYSEKSGSFKITDLSGREVMSGKLDQGINEVRCEGLKGIYFLTLSDLKVFKIIIR